MNLRKLSVIALFLPALILVGCGKNQRIEVVTDANILTYTEELDSYVNLNIGINPNGLNVPSFEFPISDPTQGDSISYGTIAMRQRLDGGPELALHLNLSEASKLPGTEPELPNGTSLPIAGIDLDSVITLPVADTETRVYLGLGDTYALVGVAIPIKEFQAVGKKLGGVNLFQGFNISDEVSGVAGVFAGRGSMDNGIAIFMDIGYVPLNSRNEFSMTRRRVAPVNPLWFKNVRPRKASTERKIRRRLYNLVRKHSRVTPL